VPEAIASILKGDGIRGFYRGNAANVLRVIPVYALKFPGNDFFKSQLQKVDAATGEALPLSNTRMLMAGSGAGFLQIVATYPLDLMRTRMALADMSPKGERYRSIAHCASMIYKHEGVLALYKGLGATLLCGVPYVGMQMTFYSKLKDFYIASFGYDAPWHVATEQDAASSASSSESSSSSSSQQSPKKLAVAAMLLCGSAAGLTAQTISFPFDVVRHRMQANGLNGSARQYSSTANCFSTMWRREGAMSFYRGWGVNAFRALPGAAIQFASYDYYKRLLQVEASTGGA
jgi:hypothetical protein